MVWDVIYHFLRKPTNTEEKVRTVIRVDLQLSRDIPILRAHRIKNGPRIHGTHPILGDLLTWIVDVTSCLRKPRKTIVLLLT